MWIIALLFAAVVIGHNVHDQRACRAEAQDVRAECLVGSYAARPEQEDGLRPLDEHGHVGQVAATASMPPGVTSATRRPD